MLNTTMPNISKSKKHIARDYSGNDFCNLELSEYDFTESVLNGCYFTNIIFSDCNLSHTEFTEARITKCKFVRCNFDYNDFVFTEIDEVEFIECRFSHVEWRENDFKDVKFANCSFNNSTINLTKFRSCSFCTVSSKEFYGASKRYNVFSNTILKLPKSKISFLRYNFGLSDLSDKNELIKFDTKDDPMFRVSVIKYFHNWKSDIFIDGIIKAYELISIDKKRSNLQKLKYLSLICRTVIEENLLSIFSQQYLINLLNLVNIKSHNSTLFIEIAELILFLRTNQYNDLNEINLALNIYDDVSVRSVQCLLELENNYNKRQINMLIESLSIFLDIDNTSVDIVKIKKGSTLVEFLINCSLNLGVFLLFINFALNQVKKVVKNINEIKKEGTELLNKKVTKPVYAIQSILPIEIIKNEKIANYDKIKKVVELFGSELIKFEGKAKLTVYVTKD